jgi:hypothetical protein
MTLHYDKSVHARNRQSNVHPREQISIGNLRESLVKAKTGGSNQPSSIKGTPVHCMIVMWVGDHSCLWFSQFDALSRPNLES